MGQYRSAIVLVVALSLLTTGVAAVQGFDGGEGIVSAGVDAVTDTDEDTQGETSSLGPGGKAQCEQGEFLAKYEFEDNEDLNGDGDLNDWVYEKGPAGDVFTVETVSDDPRDPKQIRWSSSGPSVAYLEAQWGPNVFEKSYDPPATSDTLPEQRNAYSNIVFCGPLTFQVDLIEGQPRERLETSDDLYRPENRLATAAYVSTGGDVVESSGKNTGLVTECVVITDDIDVDTGDPSTASITFDVEDDAKCDGLEVSLAAYELPGGKTSFGLPQVLADSQTVTVNGGDSDVTLTVELNGTTN